jgi:hypothetical protein
LNQRLNAIFDGKKISVNALRHSYLTDKYGSTIETKKALAKDMNWARFHYIIHCFLPELSQE